MKDIGWDRIVSSATCERCSFSRSQGGLPRPRSRYRGRGTFLEGLEANTFVILLNARRHKQVCVEAAVLFC
jgi:hypothetical protein